MISPRDPDEPFSSLTAADVARLRPQSAPRWVDPMLATLTEARFSDPRWLFERKLDGVRCLAFRDGDSVRLLSRRKQNLTDTYPEVADALAAQGETDFVVDGEVVAFEGSRTSFSLLQQRSGITDRARALRSSVAVTYYLFDILHLRGKDTRLVPLRKRKALLRRHISWVAPLKFTAHQDSDGTRLYEEACARGWEGLVAKRADSVYSSNRSPNWLKFKCEHGQEFVVTGFTEPAGSRSGFGALLVGFYEGGRLRYAGKVGTGFSEQVLRDLRRRLDAIEVREPPFAEQRRFERGVHFVRPELVAEVGFTEWTRDGMLRHPRFMGLREDKAPEDVVRERPRG